MTQEEVVQLTEVAMHPLYAAAIEVVERLEDARQRVVHLAAELAQAEYELRVRKARVERDLIKKVGGERALAPTAEDRARVFTLALDADAEYREKLQRWREVSSALEEAKVEVAALRDRLNVMLAAMRAA